MTYFTNTYFLNLSPHNCIIRSACFCSAGSVSYTHLFQSKAGNLLGKKTYRTFLVINGVVGPVLLGGAVATFFTGSDFYINKANMTDTIMPVISHWGNGWHG